MARAGDTWRARPVLGLLLRVAALLVPLLVGLLAALTLATALPPASSLPGRAAWWTAVLGGSVLATYAVDRLARRVLPLAVLLELSLVFPDRAPSRLRSVRSASVRDLDLKLARLRGEGVPMQPYEAAETLVTLVGILGLHDKRTRGHSERVRALTDLLTDELGLAEHDRTRLRWAALVHDLGKLTVPGSVLNGTDELEPSEWELLRRHPDEGVRLVQGLLPWLGEWGDAVEQHHERWDGGGYPRGLAGDRISYAARLVSVCDSFETMTSARSYKPARSAADGRRELARCAGTQFDPAVVRAFLGISLGRLTWVLGPVTWLAQVPFVAAADRAGQAVKAGTVAVAVSGLVGAGAIPGSLAVTAAPAPVAAVARPPAAAPVVPPALSGGPALELPAPDVLVPAAVGVPAAPASPVLEPSAIEPSAASPGPVSPSPAAPGAGPAASPADAPAAPSTPAAPAPSVEPATPQQPAGPLPSQTPVAAPSAEPVATADPTAAPTAAPSPTAEPDPSAPPSALPSAAADPSVAASPSPVPVATTLTYFLAPGALSSTAPGAGATSTVPRGGTVVFDRPVDPALTVTGEPSLDAQLDFQDRAGSARLTVRLLDCGTAGDCTVLASGGVDQDKSTTAAGTFVAYETALTRTTAAPQVVAAGRVLRLELSLDTSGSKADVLVALGGASDTASRLVLPATVLLAAQTPVGPSVLLVVLVLLGLSALRPARPSPLVVRQPRRWSASRARSRNDLDPRR